MSAPVSIVIPTLNAAAQIGPTLLALSEGLSEGLIAELILSDGGSSDDIAEVAEAAGATLLTGPPGRGGQIARGVAAARGSWVLILHADSQPQPGWPGAVIAHLNGATGSAGYFDLAFDDPSRAARFVAGWANLRSRLFALPYGDQGLLAPRALLCEVGVPEIPLMEDVALARALGRRRLRPIGHRIETSAEAYRRDGWVTRGAGNLWRLAQFLGGAAPERLAERYRRR